MTLWIALSIGLIGGLFRPFGERFRGTGLWAGKALVPPEAASAYPTGIKDAITDGWPSTIGLVTAILPFASLLIGSFHAWWGGISSFVISLFVGEVVKRTSIAPRSVDYYLAIFLSHANRRKADYAARGDMQRAEAAEGLGRQLQQILNMYMNSDVPAPTVKEARNAPYGEAESLLELQEIRNP